MAKLLNPTIKELEEFTKSLPHFGIRKTLNTRFTFLPENESGKETPINFGYFESFMLVPVGQEIKFNNEMYVVTEHRINLDKGVLDNILKYPKK
jgi:hypothetical protein